MSSDDETTLQSGGVTDPELSGKVVGNYRIDREVGRGGMGWVYRAIDLRLERVVALKVLPREVAGDHERLHRFEREAKALAALNHPGIVTLFEIGEWEEHPYLVLEYVEGLSLAELLTGDGLGAEPFLGVALSLCDAVAGAHRAGITHRDLKPANVLMSAEGQLKVVDFGLARRAEDKPPGGADFDQPTVTIEGRIVGTAAYMAPEQAEGKAVDARSDVFALGVMFYEMLTGSRPFRGDNPISVVTSILRDEPPPLAGIDAELSRAMAPILRRCLQKDPRERYPDAEELGAALAAAARTVTAMDWSDAALRIWREVASEDGSVSTARPSAVISRLTGPAVGRMPATLIGREEEVAAVEGALRAAVSGRSRTAAELLVLTGPAGIGKTSLLRHLAGFAEDVATVAVGQCSTDAGAPTLWPWMGIFRALESSFDLAATLESADAERLAPVLADSVTHADTMTEADRFALHDEVVRTLRSLAKQRPLVLLFEDIHWADQWSLRLLAHVVPGVGGAPVLLALTYRSDEVHGELANCLTELRRSASGAWLELPGLTGAQVAELLERDYGLRLHPKQLNQLVERTEGNPFFIRGLALKARDQGRFDFDSELPPEILEVARSRVDALPAEVQELIELAAFGSGTLAPEVDAEVLGKDLELVEEWYEVAREAGIMEPDPTFPLNYRFSHALLRDGIYSAVPARKRARLHAKIGKIVEANAGARAQEFAPELARHFSLGMHAGVAEEALRWSLEAADQALAKHAHDAASVHMQRAVEASELLGADPERHIDLLLRLGAGARDVGDPKVAKEALHEALDIAQRHRRPGWLARVALEYATGTGTNRVAPWWQPGRRGLTLLRESLSELPEDHPARPAVQAQLAADDYEMEAPRRLELFAEAAELAERHGDPALVAQVAGARLLGSWHIARPDDLVEICDAGLRAAEGVTDPRFEFFLHRCAYGLRLDAGRLDELERVLQHAEDRCAEMGMPTFAFDLATPKLLQLCAEGDLRQAYEIAAAAVEHYRHVSSTNTLIFQSVAFNTAWLLGEMGEWIPFYQQGLARTKNPSFVQPLLVSLAGERREREVRELVERWGDEVLATPPSDLLMGAELSGLAKAAVLLGDAELARAVYERLTDREGRLALPGPSRVIGLPVDELLADLALVQGRLDLARRHVDQGRRLVAPLAPLWTTRLDLIDGRISAARGDTESARSGLSRVLGEAERFEMKFVARDAQLALRDLE